MSAHSPTTLSPTPVHQHLLALLGTNNAWRTTAEIARAMDPMSTDAPNQVAKALWYLNKQGMIARRLRAGTNFKEAMALPNAAGSTARTPASAPRVEIVMPQPGPTAIQTQAAPAPVATPSPKARKAVEKLVQSPTPELTLASVLAKHNFVRSDVAVEPAPPIVSDAFVDTSGTEQATQPPESQPDLDWTEPDEVNTELHLFCALIERAQRPPPAIADRAIKVRVLDVLANIMPQRIARYLREIRSDLDLVA